jgi:hypothetical protein
MKVIITWDGDHIGRMVGRARQADEIAEVRRIGQAIDSGNRVMEAWVNNNGGSMIETGGDEGSAEILPAKLPELPAVRDQYASAVGSTVSIGVGTKLSEADRALLVAKFRGGNRIILYSPELEPEIKAATEKIENRTEAEKLSEEYLNKNIDKPASYKRGVVREAGFLGEDGSIVGSGPIHDYGRLPAGFKVKQEGYVGHDGKFYTRDQAADAVDARWNDDQAHSLHAEHLDLPEPPLTKAAPPMNQGQDAGFQGASQPTGGATMKRDVEGSEHSQGETMGRLMDTENPGAPETTAAGDGVDLESQFAQHADDQAQKPGSGPEQVKMQLVQILQGLKAQAPVLEQIKDSAPDTYKAIIGLTQVVIAMAKQMNGDPGHATAKELGDRSNPDARIEVPLPPEEDEGKEEKVKKSEKSEMDWHDCDAFGHCWGTETTGDVCLLCGGGPEELDKDEHRDKLPGGKADKKKPEDFAPEALAEGTLYELEHTDNKALAQEIAMDHLTEDPDYYKKLETIEKADKHSMVPAFRHIVTGNVYVTPGIHNFDDLSNQVDFGEDWMNPSEWEEGFVNHHHPDRPFYNRRQAAKMVMPTKAHRDAAKRQRIDTKELESQDYRYAEPGTFQQDDMEKAQKTSDPLAAAKQVTDRFGDWYDKVGRETHGWEVPDCQLASSYIGHALKNMGHGVRIVSGVALGSDHPGLDPDTHFWLKVNGRHFDPKEYLIRKTNPSFRYNQHKADRAVEGAEDPASWDPTGGAVESNEDGATSFLVTGDPRHLKRWDTKTRAFVPAQGLDKASLVPSRPPAVHHHLQLPVGTKIDPNPNASSRVGRIKVTHVNEQGAREGWIEARAGQVLSQDGHAISARNPKGK